MVAALQPATHASSISVGLKYPNGRLAFSGIFSLGRSVTETVQRQRLSLSPLTKSLVADIECVCVCVVCFLPEVHHKDSKTWIIQRSGGFFFFHTRKKAI